MENGRDNVAAWGTEGGVIPATGSPDTPKGMPDMPKGGEEY